MSKPVWFKTHDINTSEYQEVTLLDYTEMKEVVNRNGRSSLVYSFDESNASNAKIKIVGIRTGAKSLRDLKDYKYLGVVSFHDRPETWVFYYQATIVGPSSQLQFSSVFK